MNTAPVVLVTGASRGIGRGVAVSLAEAGFSVAINYVRNREAADNVAAECRKIGKSDQQVFFPIQADIGQSVDRESLISLVLKRFGRIDALVNNAGIPPAQRVDIVEATEESFDEVIGVNLKGPYFLTQKVVQYWLKDKTEPAIPGGFKIVFITSISAETASTNRGEYCISKAGLSMVVKLYASRLADEGIQVYEVRPGIIDTDMTSGARGKYDPLIKQGLVPQRRWGTPDDVGKAVRSLLEGDLAYSTGCVIDVDGGFHISRL